MSTLHDLHSLSILSMRFSMSCWGIVAHSSCSISLNSGIAGDWWRAAKRLLRVPHTFSIRFKSRDLSGKSMRWKSFTLQPLCNSHYTMRNSFFIHQEKLKTHRTSKKTNVREDNIIIIANTSDWTTLEEAEVITATNIIPPQTRIHTLPNKSLFNDVVGVILCSSTLLTCVDVQNLLFRLKRL